MSEVVALVGTVAASHEPEPQVSSVVSHCLCEAPETQGQTRSSSDWRFAI